MKKLLLYLILLLTACSSEKENTKETVFVSILPLKFFVQEIAGDTYNIAVMVPAGMSPTDYEPLPSQMLKLGKSKVMFTAGVPFEKFWIPKIKSINPDVKISKTYDGIDLHDGHTHSHGDEDHSDPHVWTDPVWGKKIAENICSELIKITPDSADIFRKNKDELLEKLDTLHENIKTILTSGKNKVFMIYHPALGYFAERYGLKQISVETEGKEPSPSQLAGFVKLVKEHDIKYILVQKQFTSVAAESIAKETGVDVVYIDQLSPEYIDMLTDIAVKVSGNYNE